MVNMFKKEITKIKKVPEDFIFSETFPDKHIKI